MLDIVKMTRTEPMHEGGPTTAKVHPVEVDNWRKCGWVVVDDEFRPSVAPLINGDEDTVVVPAGGLDDSSTPFPKAPKSEHKKPGRKPKRV